MYPLTNYIEFNREKWATLRNKTPLLLSEEELESIKGINEEISLREVEEIYLPLTRLINLKVEASQKLEGVTNSFLDYKAKKIPYIIGIAGSVAVGKSTAARVLQTLLSRWDSHKKVGLVTTDGFLYPNATLERKGLMSRKGFPESYDTQKLIQFMMKVKSGKPNVEAPLYSHLTYDVLKDKVEVIDRPDILIVEGINVLQVSKSHSVFVSDFFDFSIYIDADVKNIKKWYIERFLMLQKTAFQNPMSYFHRYTTLSKEEAVQKATDIWEEINAKNLRENILPTRRRAKIVLKKGEDHLMEKVYLKKF
ncbi:type I pantothenate kinase [Fredinandcohnia sp. QZ13]|uniref:type I pantothenate kinase n=1 Tax=Fredinandcohnia sp. QZ13 TaxID=3073144 RepID=UPI00285335BE|nr:type I pantothenate kinase [Fredinandcohnia sp. QZ13]MDR4887715.1 type I pantothenate kinase [Fredinandcohnia sp. QZ13]